MSCGVGQHLLVSSSCPDARGVAGGLECSEWATGCFSWAAQPCVSVRCMEDCPLQGRALAHKVTDRLALAVSVALQPFRLEEPRPRCVPRRVSLECSAWRWTYDSWVDALGHISNVPELYTGLCCTALIVALCLD